MTVFENQTGATLRCKGWRQEALLRLLENVLAVGEAPEKLVVYAMPGGEPCAVTLGFIAATKGQRPGQAEFQAD